MEREPLQGPPATPARFQRREQRTRWSVTAWGTQWGSPGQRTSLLPDAPRSESPCKQCSSAAKNGEEEAGGPSPHLCILGLWTPCLQWLISPQHGAHPQQLMGGSLTLLALKQVLSSDTPHLLAARLGRTSPSCLTERDSSFRGF